jgi:hypothetical protein
MQDLQGLALSDFEKKGLVILGKAEVDKDGTGNFVELENVTSFDIQSTITNLFLKTCAKSFSIELLNTNDKYSFFDTGKSEYDWIREGRKIRLYIGIQDSDDYYWSWIYGIIDKATTKYDANSETCSISGRDYIAYLSENYLKNLWWGKQRKYSIIADKEKYDMPSDCKGIYKAYKYNSTEGEYEEIVLNSEFTYDWEKNKFVFLHPNVPYETEGSIWVWYFTAQTVENVVADLLIEAGLLTHSDKQNWLSGDLVTATGKEVDRCWFESGTTYMQAIELLAERVIYRFKVNILGQPMFTQIPVLLTDTTKRLNHGEYLVRNIEERLDELYNHFYLVGEKRAMKKINLGVMVNGVEDITHNSATLVGTILADGETSAKHQELFGGSSIITKRGFKWKTDEEAEQSWYESEDEMGLFTHQITELEPETRYQWCVWAKNSLGQYAETNWNTFVTLEEEGL